VPALLIDERPPIVDELIRLGDWEGDQIIGCGGASAIGTLVDRHSREVVLVHLPHGDGAQQVSDALRATFTHLDPSERRTLTWDQRSEIASHDGIVDLFSRGSTLRIRKGSGVSRA